MVRAQPWLVGANYVPASAINQLEMWQADTFDPSAIDTELGWAAGLGINTMRVFLHDLLWQQDAEGFTAAARCSSWPSPRSTGSADVRAVRLRLGSGSAARQAAPARSRACTTPAGSRARAPRRCRTRSSTPRLEAYVKGVVGAFKDARVLAWDLWNEPDNMNGSSYETQEPATRWSSCWRCCRKCSRGRAARGRAAADERRVAGRLVDATRS